MDIGKVQKSMVIHTHWRGGIEMTNKDRDDGYVYAEGAIPMVESPLTEKEINEIEKQQREKDNQELRDVINNKK